jgi:periplasmic protein TonB
MTTQRHASAPDPVETANDRFKHAFRERFWGALIAATVIHFLAFSFWPQMSTADVRFTANELIAVDIPPEIEIPPPPERIVRPATPVVSAAQIDEDITIAPTTFESNPIENLPPPPAPGRAEDLSATPQFTPMTVAPELRNRDAVARELIRTYPPMLRDAGIGGQPTVWFFIDENGRVVRTQLNTSSGYEALDRAALDVAGIMEFSPAMNRDRRVPVWVSVPIVFRAR